MNLLRQWTTPPDYCELGNRPNRTISRTQGDPLCTSWSNRSPCFDEKFKEMAAKGEVCRSSTSFACVTRDGAVDVWGKKATGGDCDEVHERLKGGVRAIYSTYNAFAALLMNGSVEAWGNPNEGGLIPPEVHGRLKCVIGISGNYGAFAALLGGKVETWGRKDCGGDISELRQLNEDIVSICASKRAFAALRQDGTVVCWGDQAFGGGGVKGLNQVVALTATSAAFAARREDGSVVTWGSEGCGGGVELKQVEAVCATEFGFAALRKDGTVTTWGTVGDASSVSELKEVATITSDGTSFTAWRQDGSAMQTWGNCRIPVSQIGPLVQCDRSQSSSRQEESKSEESFEAELTRSLSLMSLSPAISSPTFCSVSSLAGFEEGKEEGLEQEETAQVRAPLKHEEVGQPPELDYFGEVERAEKEAKEQREALKKDQQEKMEETEGNVKREQAAQAVTEVQERRVERPTEGLEAKQLLEALEAERASLQAERESLRREQELWQKQNEKYRAAGELPSEDLKLPGGSDDCTDSPLRSLVVAPVPVIPEEELEMVEQVGEGAFSVVYKANWRRKFAASKHRVCTPVAVKMTKCNLISKSHKDKNPWLVPLFRLPKTKTKTKGNEANKDQHQELDRDLAVISGLPHQNILTLHGVSKNTEGGGLKIVFELMITDLAKYLKEANKALPSDSPRSPCNAQPRQLLPNYVLLRVLRDVSAGLAHLHSHGVIHRDVKPANVLLRDEQVKLCDFGSSRNLQHTQQKMTVAGTLDYMAPEVLNSQAVGRSADVWSFGVLLFECVTGAPCGRVQSTEKLAAELEERKCLPALVDMFVECHQADPRKRPSMDTIHTQLQKLVMQELKDSVKLKEELKKAQAQDKDTYDVTWSNCYGNQPHSQELLEHLKRPKGKGEHPPVVRQPLKLANGKGSMEELQQLATDHLCSRLHAHLKAIVEECGGTYLCARRKSPERCVQKVEQEYEGDYGKLLDLERATGLFEQAEGMLQCLKLLQEFHPPVVVHMSSSFFSSFFSSSSSSSSLSSSSPSSSPSSPASPVKVVRCKDRMNKPLPSGYRDILLNVSDAESGFVMELQLNFHKIAQIKSQSHRFYELVRVMEIKLA